MVETTQNCVTLSPEPCESAEAKAQKPITFLVAHAAQMNMEEYRNGDSGDVQYKWVAGKKYFDTFEDILAWLERETGYAPPVDKWTIFDDEESDGTGMLEAYWIETNDCREPSEKEVELWKQGKMRLWTVFFQLYVTIGCRLVVDTETFKNMTGIRRMT